MDDWKWNAEQFNKVGEQVKKEGLQLAYHNHNFEWKSYDGVTGYDEFLRLTDPGLVKLELDCGWATVAGQDPVTYLTKYPKRYSLLHIKDFRKGFTADDVTGQRFRRARWNRIRTRRDRLSPNLRRGAEGENSSNVCRTGTTLHRDAGAGSDQSGLRVREEPEGMRRGRNWMRNRCLGAGVALLLLASTSHGQADQAAEKQKAANAQQKDAAKKDDSADALAALQGPKIDKETAERGRKIFVPTCGFCHGNDAHGKSGPDLVRSALVLHDNGGDVTVQ